MTDHYDVIIIGSGAGGGTLAHKLAPSGKRILLLERGGYLPREPENWDSKAVFLDGHYLPDEQWLDQHGNRFRPHQQYFVGGNTKFYGAILFRLRERDFGEIRHHGGVADLIGDQVLENTAADRDAARADGVGCRGLVQIQFAGAYRRQP